jgi:threonine synthase
MFPKVSPENIVSLGEGWTPYVRARNYGGHIGVGDLWLKLEGHNPTGSFKDRAATLLVSLAKQLGKKGVFTASSGNAAAAISAYASRAGLKALVLIREDSPVSKIGQIAMYNTEIIRVKSLFSTKNTLLEFLEKVGNVLPHWQNGFLWAPINPLALDGIKTISYEIASMNVPDYVFVPTAGGDLLYAVFKGFRELVDMGITGRIPKIVAVQGAHADPLVRALEKGLDHVLDLDHAETIAGALRVSFGADHALQAVRASGGFGVGVTDEEILEAQRNLAKMEGVFAETSSSAALAAIKKAVLSGKIPPDSKVTAIVTGIGFKDYASPFKAITELALVDSADDLNTILLSRLQGQ